MSPDRIAYPPGTSDAVQARDRAIRRALLVEGVSDLLMLVAKVV